MCSSLLPSKWHKNRKENEHVKNLVFDVAAAFRPSDFVRQSCVVAHNTLKLPHETRNYLVVDRCTAAAMLM